MHAKSLSGKACLEFPAPEVERHGGEIAFVADHQAINHMFDRCFEGMRLEPGERRSDDVFGIAMEFGDEGRQEGKRVAAQSAKEPPDRDGIGLGHGNQIARIAPVPPQTTCLLATLTLSGFYEVLVMEMADIFVDLRFDQ